MTREKERQHLKNIVNNVSADYEAIEMFINEFAKARQACGTIKILLGSPASTLKCLDSNPGSWYRTPSEAASGRSSSWVPATPMGDLSWVLGPDFGLAQLWLCGHSRSDPSSERSQSSFLWNKHEFFEVTLLWHYCLRRILTMAYEAAPIEIEDGMDRDSYCDSVG